jgi:hypothetical protein
MLKFKRLLLSLLTGKGDSGYSTVSSIRSGILGAAWSSIKIDGELDGTMVPVRRESSHVHVEGQSK